VAVLVKRQRARTLEDLKLLIPIISQIHFFKERQISKDDYTEIGSCLAYEFQRKGEIIFEQGMYGDKFYIVLEGQVSVQKSNI
jgi:CRP-like cAMP-binding protein